MSLRDPELWGHPAVPSLARAVPRRFSSSVALTPEEQEQRALYAAILEYEQDHVSVCQGLLAGQEAVPGAGGCAMGQGAAPSHDQPWTLPRTGQGSGRRS